MPADAYWNAEQNAVSGGATIPAAADAYATSAPAPGAPSGLDPIRYDYTSARITWTPAANAAMYTVWTSNYDILAVLPASMTTVTVGGLIPGGNTYPIYVTAEGAAGDESTASNTINITTLTVPDGKAITNPSFVHGSGTITYSADYLVPFSFHRVFILPPLGSGESCWWMANDAPDQIGGPFCAHWLIENSTLLVYTGTTTGEWS